MRRLLSCLSAMALLFCMCTVSYADYLPQYTTLSPVLEVEAEFDKEEGTVTITVTIPEEAYIANADWSLIFENRAVSYNENKSAIISQYALETYGLVGNVINIGFINAIGSSDRTKLAVMVFDVIAPNAPYTFFTLKAGTVMVVDEGDTKGDSPYAVDVPDISKTVYLTEHIHNPGSAATCTEPQLCTECNEVLAPELGHSFSEDWIVDIDATLEAPGSKSHHCQHNGCTEKSEVTEIPKLEPEKLELNDGAPLRIDEYEVAEGETLACVSGVKEASKVSDVLACFEQKNVEVYSASGKELTAEDSIGTGAQIKLFDGKGEEVIDVLTVIVSGDIDGDADISTDDARAVLRKSVGLQALDGVFALAANVTDEGEALISTDDARKILRASVGLDTIV